MSNIAENVVAGSLSKKIADARSSAKQGHLDDYAVAKPQVDIANKVVRSWTAAIRA
jgi:hypothetical protein